MKTLILSFILLSVGGSAGWLLKSNTVPSSNHRVLVSQTKSTQRPPVSSGTQQVSLREIIASARTKKPLVANGDVLFNEMTRATIWVRSIRNNGKIGSKHVFVEAKESPPVSGNYLPVQYTFLNRPDLANRLIEEVREGAEADRLVLANLRILDTHPGYQRILLEVFVPNASQGNPPRVITVKEDLFPETEEDLWQLVLKRLKEAQIRTT